MEINFRSNHIIRMFLFTPARISIILIAEKQGVFSYTILTNFIMFCMENKNNTFLLKKELFQKLFKQKYTEKTLIKYTHDIYYAFSNTN